VIAVAIGTNNFLKTSPKREQLMVRCRREVKRRKEGKTKKEHRRKSKGTKNR